MCLWTQWVCCTVLVGAASPGVGIHIVYISEHVLALHVMPLWSDMPIVTAAVLVLR